MTLICYSILVGMDIYNKHKLQRESTTYLRRTREAEGESANMANQKLFDRALATDHLDSSLYMDRAMALDSRSFHSMLGIIGIASHLSILRENHASTC